LHEHLDLPLRKPSSPWRI